MTLEPLEFGPHEIMSFDDKVLVLGHERVRAPGPPTASSRRTGRTRSGSELGRSRLREFYDTATIADAFRGDRARPHEETSDVESRRT